MAAPSFDALMARPGIGGLSDADALEFIGTLIDLSTGASRDAGIARALEWSDELEARKVPAAVSATLDYFRANAWSHRADVRNIDRKAAWQWEHPELLQQVFHLRRALHNSAFRKLHKVRRCQILTNLANQLHTVGRFIEALDYLTQALEINTHFWMARGNRGRSFVAYANALYDAGHRRVMLCAAYQDLSVALRLSDKHPELGYPEARLSYAKLKARIEAATDPSRLAEGYELDGHSLGKSTGEKRYRNWCLAHHLFLNPLNDLGSHSIAARDILSLPDFVAPIDEPPVLIGFYNQMKQEFVSARWLCFEGMHADGPHYSDRDVRLFNTLDYPIYGLSVEKTKLAFRAAYSLFDKVAYFLDSYMKLGLPSKHIYFRNVWRDSDASPIRPQFESSENWPFRGLFWLSKDLFDNNFRDLAEPEAQALHEIRIHLEHKYLKVHMMPPPDPATAHPLTALWIDSLAYSVTRSDLESKTLRLLRLTRAALVYLSLGMHREEERRAAERGDLHVGKMALDVWEDDWKRRM